MSRPPKRRTYAAALRAIQRQRGRSFRRVNAPLEPQSMSKYVSGGSHINTRAFCDTGHKIIRHNWPN